MDKKETNTAEDQPRKRSAYKPYIRILALLLVILMVFSATNIDYSVLKYAGSDNMEAANYLLEHTSFLTESRYQRLVSLLTSYNRYDICMQAADSAISRSDYVGAARYLNKCAAMKEAAEELPELYTRLGCVYMLDGLLPEAEAAFDQTIALEPGTADTYLLRSQVRMNTGDVAGAEADCREYLAQGGDDEEMLLAAASIAEYLEDYATAMSAVKRLLEQADTDSQRAGYYAEQGRYYYLQGKETVGAAMIARGKACDADALDGVHYAILALAEMNRGEYALAAGDFRQAGSKADSDADSYYEQAMISAYLLQDNELLWDISQEAQQTNKMTAQSWMLTGVTAFMRTDYQEGDRTITRCLELDRTMAEAHYYRGLCRIQCEDYQGAAEDFTVSIERDEYPLDCYYNRGLCLFLMEDYEQAVTDLAYVIEDGSDPELAEAAYSLLEPLMTP